MTVYPRFLFQVWKSLASGAAIDDQCRAIVQNQNLPVEVEPPPPPVEAEPETGTLIRPVEERGLFDGDGEDEQDAARESNEMVEKDPLEPATGHDEYAYIHKNYQVDSDSDYD